MYSRGIRGAITLNSNTKDEINTRYGTGSIDVNEAGKAAGRDRQREREPSVW